MDSIKILVFAVSLILMMDGHKAQGLGCTPCNNFQGNLLMSQLQSIGLIFKYENCNKIGNCSLTAVPKKVRKCAVYQGDITLTFKTEQKLMSGLVLRQCEVVSTNEPNSCTPINKKGNNVDFFNVVLSMLKENAPAALKKNLNSTKGIAFNGSRCLNSESGAGASTSKNKDSRDSSMLMVVLVLAMFDFEA